MDRGGIVHILGHLGHCDECHQKKEPGKAVYYERRTGRLVCLHHMGMKAE